MIHTIVSLYDVFADPNAPRTVTRRIKGGLVECMEEKGKLKLNRVISTDPSIYLKKEYVPGGYFTQGKS